MPRKSVFVRLPTLLLALSTAGCAVSGEVIDWMSDDVAGTEPINYRYVIAIAIDTIIGRKDPDLRALELSPPRRKDLARGAAWIVCLKSLRHSARLPPAYFSIVIQREKMTESHIAVGTDECEAQPYAPFDWKVEATRPLLR